MTTSERLLDRLKNDPAIGPSIPPRARLRRTRAGHWQLSSGAWSWVVEPGNDIGSPYSMMECLRADALYMESDGEILLGVPEARA